MYVVRWYVYVKCPGDRLRANRQSSVYVNSSSQNIAPYGKTVPKESTTCICFKLELSKQSDTEQAH